MTWLQPEGVFMNLGQQACVKYAEDRRLAQRQKAEIIFPFF